MRTREQMIQKFQTAFILKDYMKNLHTNLNDDHAALSLFKIILHEAVTSRKIRR